MRIKLAMAMAALMLLTGCAVNLQTAVKSVNVAGVDHPYVFAEGRGVHGATLQVMDRYSPDGQTILAKDSAGSPGILSSFVQGGLAGAEMGAGLGTGLAVQGAAKVVQNTSGGGAVQSQGVQSSIKSSISNKNVNVNKPTNTNTNVNANTALGGAGGKGGEGGTGIGIGGAGGSATIQKGAVVNNNDFF